MRQNGLMLSVHEDKVATHYSLNGWKVRLTTDKQEEQFLKLYARDLRNQCPLYLIERKTELFAMHIDFDWVQPDVVTLDFMVQVLRHVGDAFHSHYPNACDKTFHAMILNSTPVEKIGSDGKTLCQKTGYHVVWPYLIVDKKRALHMRAYAVETLRSNLGHRRPPMNSFDDAVDECVLRENGFRMLGSYKAKKCKCGGRGSCMMCHGTRWLSSNRKYMPEAVIDRNGDKINPLSSRMCKPENVEQAVCLSSVRRNLSTSLTVGYTSPRDAVAIHYDDEPFKGRLKQRKKDGHRDLQFQNPIFQDDRKGAKKRKFCDNVGVDTEVAVRLLETIRTSFLSDENEPLYSKIQIRKIRRTANKSKQIEYRIDVRGFGAHYCLNVNENHSSNHIFFTVTPDGVAQGCYSRTENHSCSVQCQHWRSPCKPLPPELHLVLFPDSPERKRQKLRKQLRQPAKRSDRNKTELDIAATICTELCDVVREEEDSVRQYVAKNYSNPNAKHPLLRQMCMVDLEQLDMGEMHRLETQEKKTRIEQALHMKQNMLNKK